MFDVVLLGGPTDRVGFMRSAGMHRIATELRAKGYTVHCINVFPLIDENKLYQILAKACGSDTLLIGLSTTLIKDFARNLFFGMPNNRFIHVLGMLRQLAPKACIAAGGSQSSPGYISEIVSFKDHIDYFISGQGESAVLALVEHLRAGHDLHVETHQGVRFLTDHRYPVQGFNQLDIQYEPNDLVAPGEALPLEVARGCVFRCAYCVYDLTGKKFGDMTKTVETMRAELIRNYERHGTTNYLVTDDTINDSMEKVAYLLKVFTDLPFKPKLSAYARLDLIWRHPEMAEMLMEAGFVAFSFGLETLHEKAGRLIGKGLGEKRIKETLEHCKSVWGDRVLINANFIIGLPKEPVSSIRNTMRWIAAPDCPIDSVRMHALSVNRERSTSRLDRDETGRFLCEFSGVNDTEWKHEHLTYSGAIALRARFDQRMRQRYPLFSAVNCFSMQRLSNIGFSIDELLHINRFRRGNQRQVNMPDGSLLDIHSAIHTRSRRNLAEYEKALMNL